MALLDNGRGAWRCINASLGLEVAHFVHALLPPLPGVSLIVRQSQRTFPAVDEYARPDRGLGRLVLGQQFRDFSET
ncbi:MAG: hypothetical protein ABL994_24910 [Verrucomicrobiales bacterium]